MIKPVSPDEVVTLKARLLPDYVIEGVNECIAENYLGGKAHFTQNDVIAKILSKAAVAGIGITRQQLFGNKYLDFEDIYRQNGWQVEYDKPAYNESYEANFTFRRK